MLDDVLKAYLDYLRLIGKAEMTVSMRERHLRCFFCFLEECRVSDFGDVRRVHLVEYQRHMKQEYRDDTGQRASVGNQNRYLSAVKKFFFYLKREGLVIYNVALELELAKEPRRLPKDALPWKEIKRLLHAPDTTTLLGYRDRTMLEIFYSSGIRKGELRRLKMKDMDFEGGYLRVIGKGNKERVVPLGKAACQYVENYLKGVRPHLLREYESEYVFFGRAGKPLSDPPMDRMLEKYTEKAGLQRHLTFHSLRRSCATGMIRNNANVMHVKALLGHDSMEAIQAYIDLTIVDLKKAHEKTHPREQVEK